GGGGWGGGGGGWSESYVPDDAKTAREVESHSTGTPMWTNAPGFDKDVFTFCRIRRNRKWGTGGNWATDTPDSDLNLSFRLQQVTSIKVNPNGRYLWLTDPELFKYPFIYMVEPGTLSLDDDEVAALRKYLLNGGFLWVDDFWGEAEWEGMAEEIRKVFPDRKWVDLPLDHPLYHCVFEIKSKGQVPGMGVWQRRHVTWERPDAHETHHRVIFDDKGRIMIFATHNTDNGDGWEREGEDHYYFENFSEKISYPLGINVIFYVMTH
ncbi:MAG TPA: DUF4159 domain-containing protein, partial [Verrucomicrobiae bacterium]|nr:DUF4159 domain-containing protein [Verrucomicrobiae bacterium]